MANTGLDETQSSNLAKLIGNIFGSIGGSPIGGSPGKIVGAPVVQASSSPTTTTTAKSSSTTPVVSGTSTTIVPPSYTVPNYSQQSPTPQASTQKNSPTVTQQQPTQYSNAYLEDAQRLISQLQQMYNQPFQFTPENDPTYQASQKLAEQAGAKSSVKAMETMNDRGIFNSSITSSQIKQIEQEAALKPLELVPQLQANAFNQYQTGLQNQMGLLSTILSAGESQRGFDESQRQFNTQFGETQRQFNAQLPMQEAAITGRYMPAGAQDIIQQILDNKTKAESKGITKEERDAISSDTNILRNKLSAMGIDPNLFGSNVSLQQAYANAGKAGMPTADAQSSILGTIMSLPGMYGSLPSGAGQAISQLPMYSSLSGILSGLAGQPTIAQGAQTFNQNMAQQQFDFSKEQFTFDKTVKTNAMAIDNANQKLNAAKFEQDKNYQKWLQDNQITEQQGIKATNGYISQLMAQGSREAAMSYIVQHANDITNDGGNVTQLMNAIDAMYPAAKSSVSNQPSPYDVNKQALTMAQNDPNYLKAKTPEEKQAIVQQYVQMLMGN